MQDSHEFILAGIGGMGVLLSGELLTRGAADTFKHVVWLPNYTTAQRGAPCDCTVILSNSEIYSPLVDQVDTLVVMAGMQLKRFEPRVKPGGTILVETFALQDEVTRDDVKVIKYSAAELAAKRGAAQGANIVTLGIVIGLTGVVPAADIEKAIGVKFAGKTKALESNIGLFREGLTIGAGARG